MARRTKSQRSYAEWIKLVPERYRKGDDAPQFHTVGELKALLNELPDDLECERQVLYVANISPKMDFPIVFGFDDYYK